MLIGYARVSTHDQNLDLQKDALEKAGCEKIYVEHISGASSSRPELERAFEILREGDTLIVWRLDRLGRSLKHLIEWMCCQVVRHRGSSTFWSPVGSGLDFPNLCKWIMLWILVAPIAILAPLVA